MMDCSIIYQEFRTIGNSCEMMQNLGSVEAPLGAGQVKPRVSSQPRWRALDDSNIMWCRCVELPFIMLSQKSLM